MSNQPSLRDRLLASALRREDYDADGTTVQVRELTTRELADLAKRHKGQPELQQTAALVAVAACDEGGGRIFDDADQASDLPLRHLMGIAEVAQRLSGLEQPAATASDASEGAGGDAEQTGNDLGQKPQAKPKRDRKPKPRRR